MPRTNAVNNMVEDWRARTNNGKALVGEVDI